MEMIFVVQMLFEHVCFSICDVIVNFCAPAICFSSPSILETILPTYCLISAGSLVVKQQLSTKAG
ncbi:MAG: hypothetical protein ACRCUY_01120 [Thermoguttaceae bacterium]